MKISIIAAVDDEGGIGHHGRLPWRLRTDLRRFKALTMGHHLVMGRKTWEAIRRPLTGRVLIVISRKPGYQAPGCIVLSGLSNAIEYAIWQNEDELFVIGGGEIYAQALPLAERMYLTQVHTAVPADVFFPGYDPSDWEVVESQTFPSGEEDEFATTYRILQRRTQRGDR